MRIAVMLCLAALGAQALANHEPWATTRYPQDDDRWWHDEAWWRRGRIPVPSNHEVITREAAYVSGGVEVPVTVYRPKGEGTFPVIVFMHGRRGVDDLTRLIPLRLAARGFTVVGPDLYGGRFIPPYPLEHDYAIEDDAAAAIDFALTLPEAKGQTKLCVVSHTRGGYYSLKALVTKKRQAKAACYVSYYPHWQDPNAPEPVQVYQYARELDALAVPVLVFLGEHEQYQRSRPILAGVEALREKKREARLIVYPGVGRGFDFRPLAVRTLADDMATQDSLMRTSEFIRRHLGRK